MTKILPCNCEHEYQDQKCGVGQRVHNIKPATAKTPEVASCTVCGKGARAPSPHHKGFRSPRVGKEINSYPVR